MVAIFALASFTEVAVALVTLSVDAHACRFVDAENMSFHLVALTRVHLEQTQGFGELLKAVIVDLRSRYLLSFMGRTTLIDFWEYKGFGLNCYLPAACVSDECFLCCRST